MTTRRWMVVVLVVAVALGMVVAAVRTNREGIEAYHWHALSDGVRYGDGKADLIGEVPVIAGRGVLAQEDQDRIPRMGIVSGTIYHRTPFLSRYCRHLLGQRGVDDYLCPETHHDRSEYPAEVQSLTADLASSRREYIILKGRLIGPNGQTMTANTMMFDLTSR